MPNDIDLKVNTSADTGGLEKAREELQKLVDAAKEPQKIEALKRELEDLGKSAGKLHGESSKVQDIFKGALGANLATAGIAQLGQAVQGVINSYAELIKDGIAYNASLEDAEIGISNVIRKFQGLDEQASKQEAAKAIEAIKAAEPGAAATLDQLIQGFMATTSAAQSAGVTLQENVDLVAKFSNALANANIPASQLEQELRSIVTGNINLDSQLAKILQITNAQVREATEAGELYDFLIGKVGALGEAGDTTGVRLSTLQSQLDKVKGIVSEPAFDAWKDSLVSLSETIAGNPELVQTFASITEFLTDGVKLAAQLGGFLTGLSFGQVAEQAKRASDQMAAQREHMSALISQADTLAEQDAAKLALLTAQTAISKEIAEADGLKEEILRNQADWLRRQLDSFDKLAGKTIETKKVDEDRSKELKKQVELTDKQVKKIEEIQNKVESLSIGDLDPEDRVKELSGKVVELASQLRDAFREADLTIPGLDATAQQMSKLAEVAEGEVKVALYDQIEALAELEKKLKDAQDAFDTKKEKEAADAVREHTKAVKAATDAERKRKDAIKDTADALRDQVQNELETAQKQLEAMGDKGKGLGESLDDRSRRAELESKIAELKEVDALRQKLAPDSNAKTEIEKIREEYQKLVDLSKQAPENLQTPKMEDKSNPLYRTHEADAFLSPAQAPKTTDLTEPVNKAAEAAEDASGAVKEGFQKVADNLVSLKDGQKEGFNTLSGKVEETKGAFPGYVEPVVTQIGSLGEAVGEGFEKIAKSFKEITEAIVRRLETVERQIANL